MSPADKKEFEIAYSASYKPAREICEEMYDEVASGNEIRYLTHSPLLTHSLTHLLTYLLTPSLTYLLAHSLTYLLTHSLTHLLY